MKNESTTHRAHALVAAQLAAVEETLLNLPDIQPPALRKAVETIVASGGKRQRPMMTLLVAGMFGNLNERKVIDVAAAVEMLHTATLVHDDLIDGSMIRRGAATLNAAWTPAATLSNATITAPLATPTSTTLYTVAVIDPFGCGAKDDVLVTVIKNRNVYIPTAFSPNGDGNNDIFVPYGGIDIARIKVFRVFDRWGELVHEASNFDPNDTGFGWDGKLHGKVLDPTVLVYYLEIEFKDGLTEQFNGDVTLVK